MQKIITQLWYDHHKLAYLLLPLSWLYRFITALRRYGYKKGIFKTFIAPVPVIVVGNITVGGTGKTPLVIALVQFLKQRGYKPGIVSRGYGAQAKVYPKLVTADSDPLQVGDEPLLIAKNTHCPIVIDPKRVRAVQALLHQYACDIVISDDGLQHYALARTIEIAVIDGARRFGNGYCLPAGPLREPTARLKTVNFIVSNGKAQTNEYAMNFKNKLLKNIALPNQIKNLSDFKGQTVHTVAGIGHPQRFFQTLREYGIMLIEHEFPDHYPYQAKDLQFKDNLPIIMTEKDAVKCSTFARPDCWYLAVEAELDDEFWLNLNDRLKP